MSTDQLRPIIRTAMQSEQRLYVQPRITVHIQEGDWQRWMRAISRIPNREGTLRDLAFTLFGISVPCLLSSLTLGFSTNWTPAWPLFIYLIAGIASLIGGFIALDFDRRLGAVARERVEDVLSDMNEVRQRATVSEEKLTVPSTPTKIG